MTQWDVVLVIAGLTSLFALILTPVIKLNSTMTKLNTLMERLSVEMNTLRDNNTDSHKRLWTHNEEQDKQISNHENRINNLENRREEL